MKNINLAVILLFALIVGACKSGSPKFITVINPDGSCYKEIHADGDSAFMVGDTAKSNPFDVDLDSTWQISWSYKTDEYKTNWPLKSWEEDTLYKGSVKVKARKDFKSVEDMAKTFKLAHNHKWRNIQPQYSFDKKFRWFYTYYTYNETYPKIATLDRIPIERYMTKQEAEYWFNGKLDFIKGMNGMEIKDESEKVEEKFNHWFGHNVWDEEYEVLLNNLDLLKPSKISKEQLTQAKDSIFSKNMRFMEYFSNKDNDKNFGDFVDEYFKTKVFSELYNRKDNPLKAYEDSLNERPFMKYFEADVNYNLIMPGELIQSENASNFGDTLSFNLTAYRMVYSDYQIRATSRKANTWAFVLTGIVVLMAVGSFFVRRRK